MSAFVISEVRIVDPEAARRYVALAEESITRHGGRYVVRATEPDVPEGEWDEGRRVVVIEFPTMGELHSWYESADYAEALAIVDAALDRRLLFVSGADG